MGIVIYLIAALIGSCLSLGDTKNVKAQASQQPEQQPEWIYQTGGMVSVSISSDGNYIVAGSDDGKVYLFDKSSSTPLWSYTTGGYVNSVSISSDGYFIATGGYGGTVYFFNRLNSAPVWSSLGKGSEVSLSSDGQYIAAGGYSNNIYLFDRFSNTPLWSVEMSSSPKVSISSDGNYVVVGSLDWVYLFSKTYGPPIWSYQTTGSVTSVSISSDGSYVAAGDSTGKVYLLRDGISELAYQASGEVSSVSVSSDGSYIVAGTRGYYVYLLNRSSGLSWSYYTDGQVRSVAISSDGSYIVAGGKGVYFFSRSSGTPIWYSSWIYQSVSISSDGSYIAAGTVSYFSGDVEAAWVRLFRGNTSPTLTFGSVSPSSGTTSITFTYEVTYTDADGDAPSYVKVYIDGTGYSMTKISGTYTGGALYSFSSTLSAGSHNYYFEASDGTAMVRLPSDGTYSGPTVKKPTELTTSVAEGAWTSSLSSELFVGQSQTINAKLMEIREAGSSVRWEVVDKTLTWNATAGTLSPSSTTTNSLGRASVTYHAPSYPTTATITISFAGDDERSSSSASISIAINFAKLTFLKPDGRPLANKEIYYSYTQGGPRQYLGTTDSSGTITVQTDLGSQTVYFETSDRTYAGNAFVSSGSNVSTSLTEAAAFPWLAIFALVVVCGVAGGVALVWKRGPRRSGIIASAGALGFIVPFLLTLSWSAIGAFLIGGFVSAWCAVGTYLGVKAKAYMTARVKARPKPPKHAPPELAKPAGKFCAHCKLKLPADAEFCPECGRKVK